MLPPGQANTNLWPVMGRQASFFSRALALASEQVCLAQVQTVEPILQTHQRYWHKLGWALGAGSLALSFALLVGAAWLGRLGTPVGRGAACLLLVAGVAWTVYARVHWGKASRKPERVFRGIVAHVDPVLSRKLLSAATLLAQRERESDHISEELTQLHFARLLAQIPLSRVEERGRTIARWVKGVALGLSCLTLLWVLMDPLRVVEGVNVLLAYKGRAPFQTTWIDLDSVSAQAPSYLRMPTAFVEPGSPSLLPKGSMLTLRGLQRFDGRKVILTDGKAEVPFVSDGHGGISARFALAASARLQIAVRFGDVLIFQSPLLEVTALDDETPEVLLEQAPRRFDIAGMSEVTLRYRAGDDHGLRQIDLILRSGSRQEQRQLVRLDGALRQYEGAHVLSMNDPFIVQSAGAISLVVSARDDNAVDGPKYGASEAIVLYPPSLGSAQKQRYQSLVQLRDALVDWFDLIRRGGTLQASREHHEQHVGPAERRFLADLDSSGRANVLLREFLRGQSEKLRPARLRGVSGEKILAEAILAVDALTTTLGQRDAEQVARQLARVAEELVFAARAARGPEGRDRAIRNLVEGQERLRLGASTLAHLGVLGADLGQVATAGVMRIQRAFGAGDFVNTERAASFLTERLDRPVPSFLGGGRPGVESGTSQSTGSGRTAERARPSEADTRFERLANELAQLTEEHATNTASTGLLVDKMAQMDESATSLPDAVSRAHALSQSVESLPELGSEPGTAQASLALAKELTRGAAESLRRYRIGSALDGLRQAEGALTEAAQLSRVTLSGSDDLTRALSRVKAQITAQRLWLESKAEDRSHDVAKSSMEALRNLAPAERSLMDRARSIVARESRTDRVLPEDFRDRLEQAAGLMSQAVSELQIARGAAAYERQRAAQSLLEQLSAGGVSEASKAEDAERREGKGGRARASEGAVTSTSDVESRERFRRRVLEGLSREMPTEGAAKVRRYAEGLLR